MNYSWIKRRKFKLNVTIDNWRDVFYLLLSSFSSLGSILLKMSNESHDLSPRRHPTIFLTDILGLDKRDVTFLGTGTPRKLGGAGGKYWSSARKKKSRGGGGNKSERDFSILRRYRVRRFEKIWERTDFYNQLIHWPNWSTSIRS